MKPFFKILVVSHGFPPREMAGAEIYAFQIARRHLALGHEVVVFCPRSDPGQPEFEVLDDVVQGLRVRRMNNTWRFQHRLEDTYRLPEAAEAFRRVLDDERPDLVHVHHTVGTTAAVIPIARAAGVPVVVTLHDFWFHCARGQRVTPRGHVCDRVQPWRCSLCVFKKRGRYGFDWLRAQIRGEARESRGKSALRRGLELVPRLLGEAFRQVGTSPIHRRLDFMRDALLAADRILAPSEFLRQGFIDEGIPADRIEFWENGHDAERFVGQAERRAAQPAQGRVRFGFVGTLIPNKGPELLVRAFQDLPAGRATLDVHGRGGGPKGAEYEAWLASLNRHPDLRFHGPFDNARVGEVLAGLDVLVVPSLWYENSPLTLNEAVMAGLAVVTSDFGGMRELADRFGHALVFPVGDQAALTTTLRRFLDEPGLAAALSRTERPVRTIDEDAEGQIARYRELVRGQPGPDGAG